MRVLMPEKELDTFSSTDALAYMQNLIETLDLPVASTPEIYALNQECVENAKTNVGVDIPWDDEADAYMLVYLTEIDSVAAANYTISSSVSDMTEGRRQSWSACSAKTGWNIWNAVMQWNKQRKGTAVRSVLRNRQSNE